jgi:hypothetical protein
MKWQQQQLCAQWAPGSSSSSVRSGRQEAAAASCAVGARQRQQQQQSLGASAGSRGAVCSTAVSGGGNRRWCSRQVQQSHRRSSSGAWRARPSVTWSLCGTLGQAYVTTCRACLVTPAACVPVCVSDFCHLASAAAAVEQHRLPRIAKCPGTFALQQVCCLLQPTLNLHVASTGLALFFVPRLMPDLLGSAISVAVAGPCSWVHEPKPFACSSIGRRLVCVC